MRKTLAILIIAIVSVAGAWLWAQSLRRQIRDERVSFANQLAAKDQEITRLATVNDSQVAVTRRLAFQVEGSKIDLRAARTAYNDMLDSVEVMGVALAEFRVRGDSLEAVLLGQDAEQDSMGMIRAEGAFDSLGVDVRASVEIPPTLETPEWTWFVARDPLTLSVGLECEGSLAAAYVTGPQWASVAVDSVVQQAGICNPMPEWRPFELKVPSVPMMMLLVGGGMLLQSKLDVFE